MNNIVRHGKEVPTSYMDDGDLITRHGKGYMVIEGEEVQITNEGGTGYTGGESPLTPKPLEKGTFNLPYGMIANYVYNPNTKMVSISVKSFTNISATGTTMEMGEKIPEDRSYLLPYEDVHITLANSGANSTGPTVLTLTKNGGTALTNRTTGENVLIGGGIYFTK